MKNETKKNQQKAQQETVQPFRLSHSPKEYAQDNHERRLAAIELRQKAIQRLIDQTEIALSEIQLELNLADHVKQSNTLWEYLTSQGKK